MLLTRFIGSLAFAWMLNMVSLECFGTASGLVAFKVFCAVMTMSSTPPGMTGTVSTSRVTMGTAATLLTNAAVAAKRRVKDLYMIEKECGCHKADE